MDINPWYDQEKWPNYTFLIYVYHVKELIACYKNMFEFLELDLLN